MSDKIDKVLEKLDKLDGRVDNIDVTLGRQSVVLDEHVRRTDLLEKKMTDHEEKIDRDLAPVRKHVALVGAIGKIIAGIGALAAFTAALKELLE